MDTSYNLNYNDLPHEAVKSLVEAIVEDISRQSDETEEPVELYLHKIQSKLFAKSDALGVRLSSGYQSLLKEISEENKNLSL